ncbi:hypothetical protein Y032_0016g3028 [Ancylostoma ceylanicum]|uniref:Uncharacterized protein n=1 Tax=Ancylostoma ceylanicum TaxID=53326 RepID=A0A016V6P4_9BILA|nr:hypothetical protein Y032_0016g3028 [Ancylostoma ceylanicum]
MTISRYIIALANSYGGVMSATYSELLRSQTSGGTARGRLWLSAAPLEAAENHDVSGFALTLPIRLAASVQQTTSWP